MEKKKTIVAPVGNMQAPAVSESKITKHSDVVESAMRVIRALDPSLAAKLDSLWGYPSCDDYLLRLLERGHHPDVADAAPLSPQLRANIVILSDSHLVTKVQPSSKPVGKPSNLTKSTNSPPSDVLVERRQFPRKITSDQLDVVEKNTESVWASFNAVYQEKTNAPETKVQRYPTILARPVNESGQSLGADSATAADEQQVDQLAHVTPTDHKQKKPLTQFASTQPMTEDMLSAYVGADVKSGEKQALSEKKGFLFSFALSADEQKTAALAQIAQCHPKIAQAIDNSWGQAACVDYLQQLVFDGYDHADKRSRVGFKTEVISAMMTLMTLHPAD